ncbi:hypothetical protein D0Z70_00285 [Sphingobium terrigena]|uniref:Uncharacterized protein n=1 Tax=Sphingobium terrigena TaxID=2304063 RepID=A0A418YXV3_9SPHN|nr:hypothetical protein D0Z70_00285 [Sphingobium terrigena]
MGLVPILAAGLGAVATVLAQKYLGDSGQPTDAVIAVLKMPGLTAADRIKLIDAVTRDSERFYSFLHLMLGALGAPLGFLLVRFAPR